LQIVRNVGATELINHCSLSIKIAPNFFSSLSHVFVALDNRPETKETKSKLKKENKH
jgi:hypothetical protein